MEKRFGNLPPYKIEFNLGDLAYIIKKDSPYIGCLLEIHKITITEFGTGYDGVLRGEGVGNNYVCDEEFWAEDLEKVPTRITRGKGI
ncbi:MAG: hypothetical protein LBQ37_02575 [Elusimicrobiota bacterium]|jgi:hypothetical protein|nr:hypothetical protein [Elusimicrobiota bacterium]